MCHHIGLLYTDDQTELLAGMGETTDKLLQAVFCVRSQGCVICEQHLADEHVCDFCFCTQSGSVEELAVSPGVDVDSLAAVLEGVLEEHGEKDTEKCRRKDAPLCYPLLTGKAWDVAPSKWTMLCMSSWNDVMMASRWGGGGHPIFLSSSSSLLQLTRSNALVRSMKAM